MIVEWYVPKFPADDGLSHLDALEAMELQWDTWDAACDFVTVDGFRGCYIDDDGFPVDDLAGVTEIIGALIPVSEEVTLVARQGDYIVRYADGQYLVYDPIVFEREFKMV